MLSHLILPPVLNTSSANLITDFFEPVLAKAVKYNRGVGYFSSGWLRMAARGMVRFAANGGQAQWITSPILAAKDWEALVLGDAARTDRVLLDGLRSNIQNLEIALERDTLSALAWMVADQILNFKIALPQNKLIGGDFHVKFGVFTDEVGNSVSFDGSYNDSIQGLRNYEQFKVFCSWKDESLLHYIQADIESFERIWNNQDANVRVFELPEAAREQILRLRTEERPYPEPEWVRERRLRETGAKYKRPQPAIPEHILLRGYQEKAIEAWFKHDCRGLFEMATGTGKTITALAASVRLHEMQNQLAVIIAVPYQHLVDQWKDEARSFGYRPLLAYRSKKRWLDALNNEILEFNAGHRPFISVITTHSTFISREFQATIARLKGNLLLIADEAHHLGAERSRQNYPRHVHFRLALSATPDRWFDDVGTTALRDYFGETVFSFPLEKAIGVSLTNYYYHPHLVPLSDMEMEAYEKLTVKIARMMGREDDDGQEILKHLLIKRANLLNKTENKLEALSKLVDQQDEVSHALFYCAPGQIDDVLHLLGWEKGIPVHRFTAEENNDERQRLLTDFASGALQGLVAMKCLDEGVDVPATETAFFLASSSNPREFIQRRGRILRKSPGKEYSVIHDLIAVPPTVWNTQRDSPSFEVERSIMRRELQRFKEFANPALNKHKALDVIWDIASRYGLLDF